MTKPISRLEHGFTDDPRVAVFAAPQLLGFSGNARNTFLARGVCGLAAGLPSRPGKTS